jgi:hypothetical protein
MERQIKRSDILVRMVMLRQPDIVAIEMAELQHAKVGHVIETLHASRQHYALVVESDPHHGGQSVRGLFSLGDISKRIGENLMFDFSEASSLAELQKSLENK